MNFQAGDLVLIRGEFEATVIYRSGEWLAATTHRFTAHVTSREVTLVRRNYAPRFVTVGDEWEYETTDLDLETMTDQPCRIFSRQGEEIVYEAEVHSDCPMTRHSQYYGISLCGVKYTGEEAADQMLARLVEKNRLFGSGKYVEVDDHELAMAELVGLECVRH